MARQTLANKKYLKKHRTWFIDRNIWFVYKIFSPDINRARSSVSMAAMHSNGLCVMQLLRFTDFLSFQISRC